MLTDQTKNAITKLQSLYPDKRSALIPALHLAQAEVGYLPLEVQNEIAILFEIHVNEVSSVVTFYDMFYEEPIGKHLIHVCKNISCMLNGGDSLLFELCNKLKIKQGQTTADQQFTVIPSECLGACDRAPMMLVNEKVWGPVSIENLDQILDNAKNSPGHPSPITIEEVNYG